VRRISKLIHIHGAYVWYPNLQLDKYIAPQHNEPVSTILLQENSFKPAHEAGFFLPMQTPPFRHVDRSASA
jgi:hypothetical protein